MITHFAELLRHGRLQSFCLILGRVHRAGYLSQPLLQRVECLDTLDEELVKVLRVVVAAVMRCHVLKERLKRLNGKVFVPTLLKLEFAEPAHILHLPCNSVRLVAFDEFARLGLRLLQLSKEGRGLIIGQALCRLQFNRQIFSINDHFKVAHEYHLRRSPSLVDLL